MQNRATFIIGLKKLPTHVSEIVMFSSNAQMMLGKSYAEVLVSMYFNERDYFIHGCLEVSSQQMQTGQNPEAPQYSTSLALAPVLT